MQGFGLSKFASGFGLLASFVCFASEADLLKRCWALLCELGLCVSLNLIVGICLSACFGFACFASFATALGARF